MAEDIFEGPLVALGPLMNGTSPVPLSGPSIMYQGNAVLDPRFAPARKDGTNPARLPAFMNSFDLVCVDTIPQASATNILVAAQSAATATLFTLSGTALGGSAASGASWCPGVPIIPLGGSSVVTVSAIDFGFTTGTTTSASSTVNVPNAFILEVGGWYVIGGGANTGNTGSLLTQVVAAVSSTSIQVSPPVVGGLANAPIGRANLFGSSLLPPGGQLGGPNPPAPSAATIYQPAGVCAVYNPIEACTRNVSVQCNTATGGTSTVLVTGYDIWGNLLTELLAASGTTIVFGNKAFKYIVSAKATSVGAATYTLGLGDTVGFPVRSDKWEYTYTAYAGVTATNKNGWTAAFAGVATNTTGDVRGTMQISTAGALGTSVGAPLINGTSRLFIQLSVAANNLLFGQPSTYTSMFGVAQSIT